MYICLYNYQDCMAFVCVLKGNRNYAIRRHCLHKLTLFIFSHSCLGIQA